MKKTSSTKPALRLNKETLRNLTSQDMWRVRGGNGANTDPDGADTCASEVEHGCKNPGGDDGGGSFKNQI
jgi:hypothetical protein